jgi:hypothetical protein
MNSTPNCPAIHLNLLRPKRPTGLPAFAMVELSVKILLCEIVSWIPFTHLHSNVHQRQNRTRVVIQYITLLCPISFPFLLRTIRPIHEIVENLSYHGRLHYHQPCTSACLWNEELTSFL